MTRLRLADYRLVDGDDGRARYSLQLWLVDEDGNANAPVALDGARYDRPILVEPLVEGARYRTEFCATTSEFVVGPAAPLPTTLGSIAFHERATYQDWARAAGLCADDVLMASAEVVFTPDATLEAWLPYLDFTFEVAAPGQAPWRWDFPVREEYRDQLFPPADWTQRTRFRPYTLCEDKPYVSPGLEPGRYTGVLKGRVPGTDHIVSTEPVPFELVCTPTIAEPEPDIVEPGVAEPDLGEPDVAEPETNVEVDLGEPNIAEPAAAEGIASDPASNDERCTAGGASLVGLAFLALRRRRT